MLFGSSTALAVELEPCTRAPWMFQFWSRKSIHVTR
jgi:hypothetical protein